MFECPVRMGKGFALHLRKLNTGAENAIIRKTIVGIPCNKIRSVIKTWGTLSLNKRIRLVHICAIMCSSSRTKAKKQSFVETRTIILMETKFNLG